jgi:hypothetical protein
MRSERRESAVLGTHSMAHATHCTTRGVMWQVLAGSVPVLGTPLEDTDLGVKHPQATVEDTGFWGRTRKQRI